jgi:pyrroloquinoline quinone (PQQ) biosynthesis protein C
VWWLKHNRFFIGLHHKGGGRFFYLDFIYPTLVGRNLSLLMLFLTSSFHWENPMLNQAIYEGGNGITCQNAPYIKQEWLTMLGDTLFLTRCRTGHITRNELHTFVRQHQLYSRHFTRYLSALLCNMDSDHDRQGLIMNLFDEMGLGDSGNVPHSILYKNMMNTMGILTDDVPLPTTTLLIDAMFECCKYSNLMVGLGALCLGAEGIVPKIYSTIVNGFLSVGEPMENLQFFNLHIGCDDEHSKIMYGIIKKELSKNPNAMIDLNYGANKLIQARVDFFNGLTCH